MLHIVASLGAGVAQRSQGAARSLCPGLGCVSGGGTLRPAGWPGAVSTPCRATVMDAIWGLGLDQNPVKDRWGGPQSVKEERGSEEFGAAQIIEACHWYVRGGHEILD